MTKFELEKEKQTESEEFKVQSNLEKSATSRTSIYLSRPKKYITREKSLGD